MSYFPMDLEDEETTLFRPLTQERINSSQEAPPRWGQLMKEIREPGEAASSVSSAGMLPQYQLVQPIEPIADVFQQDESYSFPSQSVAYPHVPFWTGAPLPFAPQAFPQAVLPAEARQGVLQPKTKAKRRGASKRDSGRVRDKGGLFVSKKEETKLLKGKIAELESALHASQAESAYLREALRRSAEELRVLRSQGLVQQGLARQTTPILGGGADGNPFRTRQVQQDDLSTVYDKSPRNAEEAFRISLNYAELKNGLRPTGFSFEPAPVYPL